ncbi:hypothetical protein DPMN_143864 [Dreissena polymorpha]|uniref:Uncharacterized protein n=1 Tax=Dreissena polymorpha TaxID=45954 RepID=A0A9D4GJY4_DREPO|nr:hypothetical protein DPMN_143864 [Dreissena polymorpha]
MSPVAVVLSIKRRFTVFTPISALQLLCGKATEHRRWCTSQSLRIRRVAAAVNSGPPSEASSSGIPYVTKIRLRHVISPWAPLADCSIMGQLE